jgi:hypothetical protein
LTLALENGRILELKETKEKSRNASPEEAAHQFEHFERDVGQVNPARKESEQIEEYTIEILQLPVCPSSVQHHHKLAIDATDTLSMHIGSDIGFDRVKLLVC